MVPPGSPLKSIADVDKKGVRLVVSARSAYGLWLENNIKNATLIQVTGLDGAFNKFIGRQARRAGRPAAGPAKDLEKHAGRENSRRQVHRRAAGRRLQQARQPRARAISPSSSRTPRSRAWWRA